MSMPEIDHRIYLLAGGLVFSIAFYSLLVQANLLRRIMALNVMGSGVFLVYIAIAARTPGAVPDPVPHAMVLTGIVVSVCATGLALALADSVQVATGKTELAPDPPYTGAERSSASARDPASDAKEEAQP